MSKKQKNGIKKLFFVALVVLLLLIFVAPIVSVSLLDSEKWSYLIVFHEFLMTLNGFIFESSITVYLLLAIIVALIISVKKKWLKY
jgi:uncharacterized BrkB/YihY/UPF0761 family membrane protein